MDRSGQAATPVAQHVGWIWGHSRLRCYTHRHVPELSVSHVRIDHSTPWQAQDAGWKQAS